jgi:hypothetical protein
MDFSEFYTDIAKQMKIPKIDDIDTNIKEGISNLKTYDSNASDKSNKKTGINIKLNIKEENYAK